MVELPVFYRGCSRSVNCPPISMNYHKWQDNCQDSLQIFE